MNFEPIFGKMDNEVIERNFEKVGNVVDANGVKLNQHDTEISNLKNKDTQHESTMSGLQSDIDTRVTKTELNNAKSDLQNQITVNVEDINSTNNRIDNLILESDIDPNKDQEILDSRHSLAKNITYDTISDRLEAVETNHKYFWEEFKAVEALGSSFTLTNTFKSYQKLEIVDTKYWAEWIEGVDNNYTRSGQIITLPILPEKLVFRIRAI